MAVESWVGTTIGGKYRVDAVIGKGGMGVVLRATHLRLGEPVAIKVLLPAMLDVPGMVARFMREARAASKIKSAHVVRVTDVDTLEDGVPYMVMEYLEGTDLAALRRKEGPFHVPDAARYLLEACDAIAEAHSLGIVHRDLKPGNLFIGRTRDGANVLKVLDFGISKLDAPEEQDTTKTGQMMGSPKYMSPEQMLSMHDVDGRSDIWSLGAILYELLSGRPPFLAESAPRVCALVLNEAPQPPSVFRPELPPDLDRIVLRCLEKDPNRRYPTVADFAADLRRYLAPEEAGRLNTSSGLFARPYDGRGGVEPPRPSSGETGSPVPVTVGGRGHSGSWGSVIGANATSASRAKFAGIAILVLVALGVFGLMLRGSHTTQARDGAPADPSASGAAPTAPANAAASATSAGQATQAAGSSPTAVPSDPDPASTASKPTFKPAGVVKGPMSAVGVRKGPSKAGSGQSSGAVNPFDGRH